MLHDDKHQTKGLLIALGHQARVGKDTVATLLESKIGGQDTIRLSFAAPLYKLSAVVQTYLGKPVEKVPPLLQALGTTVRECYGEDYWVNILVATVVDTIRSSPGTSIIVTDLRYPNEMKALKSIGFTMVRVTRCNRIIDRDPRHPSETALLGAEFDYTVCNDGTMEDLDSMVDTLLHSIVDARV
jgi:hypothetical protein